MNSLLTFRNFTNLNFGEIQFTKDDLTPLREEVKGLKKDKDGYKKANNELVGQIKQEYILTKSFDFIENLLTPYVNSYISENKLFAKYNIFLNDYILFKDHNVRLNKLWVNFQNKHEFNPTHFHTGLVTFVIWLQIPYKIEEEAKLHPGKHATESYAGAFSFYITDILGDIGVETFIVDKSWKYKCLIFPSALRHHVYPFYTSNKSRISVSGNFCLANLK